MRCGVLQTCGAGLAWRQHRETSQDQKHNSWAIKKRPRSGSEARTHGAMTVEVGTAVPRVRDQTLLTSLRKFKTWFKMWCRAETSWRAGVQRLKKGHSVTWKPTHKCPPHHTCLFSSNDRGSFLYHPWRSWRTAFMVAVVLSEASARCTVIMSVTRGENQSVRPPVCLCLPGQLCFRLCQVYRDWASMLVEHRRGMQCSQCSLAPPGGGDINDKWENLKTWLF